MLEQWQLAPWRQRTWRRSRLPAPARWLASRPPCSRRSSRALRQRGLQRLLASCEACIHRCVEPSLLAACSSAVCLAPQERAARLVSLLTLARLQLLLFLPRQHSAALSLGKPSAHARTSHSCQLRAMPGRARGTAAQDAEDDAATIDPLALLQEMVARMAALGGDDDADAAETTARAQEALTRARREREQAVQQAARLLAAGADEDAASDVRVDTALVIERCVWRLHACTWLCRLTSPRTGWRHSLLRWSALFRAFRQRLPRYWAFLSLRRMATQRRPTAQQAAAAMTRGRRTCAAARHEHANAARVATRYAHVTLQARARRLRLRLQSGLPAAARRPPSPLQCPRPRTGSG
jgi:hypothetical protein